MKTRLLIFIPVIAAVVVISSAFVLRNQQPLIPANPDENLVIPQNVNDILQKSCFGCHNQKSDADKAKKKLLLDELTSLSKAKIAAKLDKMDTVLTERKMPPEKFLQKFPDKALTDEEYQTLIDWVNSASDELMK